MNNSIAQNLEKINKKLVGSIAKLVAVTKTQPIAVLEDAYKIGLKRFGENKVQEMVEKYEALPKDIEWHMIGHLQTNKVKYITHFVYLIHSVDSLKLLVEINKQAAKSQRIVNCLLQVFIATEETKFGMDNSELIDLLESDSLKALENIKLIGLMGMASNTLDTDKISAEFENLKLLYFDLRAKYNTNNVEFTELSMGMSGDFELAIAHASTLVRVGSALFGLRNY